MFKQTTVTKYYKTGDVSVVEKVFDKFNDAIELIGFVEKVNDLETSLEDQIKYKKNKDFLYANRFKRRFYYYRDEDRHPRVTICVICDPTEKIYCRGISLCSFMDHVNKENGRDMAEDRAIKAFKSKTTSEEILRSETDEIVISAKNFVREIGDDYKSSYAVVLTDFEKKLFSPKNENGGK